MDLGEHIILLVVVVNLASLRVVVLIRVDLLHHATARDASRDVLVQHRVFLVERAVLEG